jgi:hypothetical protein
MARSMFAIALLVLANLEVAAANGFCGGFDLDNHGQAGQCLSDDNSRNGASVCGSQASQRSRHARAYPPALAPLVHALSCNSSDDDECRQAATTSTATRIPVGHPRRCHRAVDTADARGCTIATISTARATRVTPVLAVTLPLRLRLHLRVRLRRLRLLLPPEGRIRVVMRTTTSGERRHRPPAFAPYHAT